MTNPARVPRYAVVPTHNRPAELAACLAALDRQVDTVVVIDNASDPPVRIPSLWGAYPGMRISVIRDEEQPPNLARLWNVGLDYVAAHADVFKHPQWDVAILNDDALVPAGWYEACSAAMRAGPAVAASSGPHASVNFPLLKTEPDTDLHTRMCPHAFVTRGEVGLRADESMRWWWQDSDWDWQARAAGGVAIIAGYPTQNTGANSSTVGVLAEQAARDRATFAAKHGSAPW